MFLGSSARLGGVSGGSWRRLGSFRRRLGGVLGRLGGVLACLGGVLCRRGLGLILLFVVVCCVLMFFENVDFSFVFSRFLASSARLGGVLGLSWRRLGGVLEASWRVLGVSWASLGGS